MGEVTWTAYGTETDALTTELNSLADGAESALGTEIDNTSPLDLLMDLNIALASLTPTGSPEVVIGVYRSVDGTNYPDLPSVTYTAAVTTGSGVKRATIEAVPLTPGKTKLTLTNETNVALAASGNTVKYRTYGPTVA